MATNTTTSTGNHRTTSELEKFTLFYESVPLERHRSKRQVQRTSDK